MTGPEPRIGDRERDAAVTALGEHYATGRITKDEFDERSARAWSAKTASDLSPLFADLPTAHDLAAWAGRPSTRLPAPAPVRTAARTRRGMPHPPLVPLLAILVGLVILTGVPVIVLLLVMGAVWFGMSRRGRVRHPAWSRGHMHTVPHCR